MKKIDANTLPDDVEALKAMLLEQQAEKARLQQESERWKRDFYQLFEKWQLELKKRFAASAEGLPGQGDLFNEVEDILNPDEEEVAAEQHVKKSFTISAMTIKPANAVARTCIAWARMSARSSTSSRLRCR